MKIGILGKMASGKSTLASRIIEKHPNMRLFSLASPVKEMAKILFNMQGKDRELLQKVGTKMREIDPDVWVNLVLAKIKRDNIQDVIIDDVRYENEIVKLKKTGFKIYYLEIDSQTQEKYLKETYKNNYETHLKCCNHESEQADTLKHLADMTITHNTDLDSILS